MRTLRLFLVALALVCVGAARASAQPTLVASSFKDCGFPSPTCTSNSIAATGGNLIIVYGLTGNSSTCVATDSLSNVYTPVNSISNLNVRMSLYAAYSPLVSGSMTVSFGGSGNNCYGLTVLVFSGAATSAANDKHVQTTFAVTASAQVCNPGCATVVPSQNNSLFTNSYFCGQSTSGTWSINGGYTMAQNNTTGINSSYLRQTTAADSRPTISVAGGNTCGDGVLMGDVWKPGGSATTNALFMAP